MNYPTIQKDNNHPAPFVYAKVGRKVLVVYRLSYHKQKKCSHEWYPVAYRGSGGWNTVCLLCGGLAR
jgi:hypothetical protein